MHGNKNKKQKGLQRIPITEKTWSNERATLGFIRVDGVHKAGASASC